MSLLANWCRYFFGKAFFNFFYLLSLTLSFFNFCLILSFFYPFFFKKPSQFSTVKSLSLSLSHLFSLMWSSCWLFAYGEIDYTKANKHISSDGRTTKVVTQIKTKVFFSKACLYVCLFIFFDLLYHISRQKKQKQ
jgi:hypothetical protein